MRYCWCKHPIQESLRTVILCACVRDVDHAQYMSILKTSANKHNKNGVHGSVVAAQDSSNASLSKCVFSSPILQPAMETNHIDKSHTTNCKYTLAQTMSYHYFPIGCLYINKVAVPTIDLSSFCRYVLMRIVLKKI